MGCCFRCPRLVWCNKQFQKHNKKPVLRPSRSDSPCDDPRLGQHKLLASTYDKWFYVMRLKPTLKPGTLPHLNSRSLFCETSNLAVEIESTTPKKKGLTFSTSISLYGWFCEIEAAWWPVSTAQRAQMATGEPSIPCNIALSRSNLEL